MNKVLLVGRICKMPPEEFYNDRNHCWFWLAVKRDYKTEGEFETDYINLKVFGKTKDYFLDHFNLGDLIWTQCSIKDVKETIIVKNFVVQQIFKLEKSKGANKKFEISKEMEDQIKQTYS